MPSILYHKKKLEGKYTFSPFGSLAQSNCLAFNSSSGWKVVLALSVWAAPFNLADLSSCLQMLVHNINYTKNMVSTSFIFFIPMKIKIRTLACRQAIAFYCVIISLSDESKYTCSVYSCTHRPKYSNQNLFARMLRRHNNLVVNSAALMTSF